MALCTLVVTLHGTPLEVRAEAMGNFVAISGQAIVAQWSDGASCVGNVSQMNAGSVILCDDEWLPPRMTPLRRALRSCKPAAVVVVSSALAERLQDLAVVVKVSKDGLIAIQQRCREGEPVMVQARHQDAPGSQTEVGVSRQHGELMSHAKTVQERVLPRLAPQFEC